MLKPALRRCVARGLSLVELMVGIAVGMFVVAAAATLVATQLTENRGLQLELQVQQDLRATADIITRELRRGASLASFGDATSYVWTPGVPWIFIYNNTVATPASGVTEEVTFTQARSPGGRGSSGFDVNSDTGKRLAQAISVSTAASDDLAALVGAAFYMRRRSHAVAKPARLSGGWYEASRAID